MATQQPNGFSAIITLVALAILISIGAGGWFVLHKNSHTGTTKNPGQTATNTAQKEAETTKPSDPSEGGTYLVIEEMKVRFPLSDDLRGDILTHVTTNGPNVDAYFASKKLNNLIGDNTCGFVTQSSGDVSPALEASLHRIDPNVEFKKVSRDYYLTTHTLLKKTATYEYYANKDTQSKINCLTNTQYDGQYNDILNKIVSNLNNSFLGLEVIN